MMQTGQIRLHRYYSRNHLSPCLLISSTDNFDSLKPTVIVVAVPHRCSSEQTTGMLNIEGLHCLWKLERVVQ